MIIAWSSLTICVVCSQYLMYLLRQSCNAIPQRISFPAAPRLQFQKNLHVSFPNIKVPLHTGFVAFWLSSASMEGEYICFTLFITHWTLQAFQNDYGRIFVLHPPLTQNDTFWSSNCPDVIIQGPYKILRRSYSCTTYSCSLPFFDLQVEELAKIFDSEVNEDNLSSPTYIQAGLRVQLCHLFRSIILSYCRWKRHFLHPIEFISA